MCIILAYQSKQMENTLLSVPQTPIHIDEEAYKMLDHFNNNLPQGGGEMIAVYHYSVEHLPHAQQQWKAIYERATQIQRNENSRRRAVGE